MTKKPAAKGKRKSVRKKAGSSRKRLTPRKEKRGLEAGEIFLPLEERTGAPLVSEVEEAGGAAIGAYREPLSGKPVLLATLPIAAVAPAGRGLAAVQEPVRSHQLRMVQRTEDVFLVSRRPRLLVLHGPQAGMQHAAVQRAEMELADDHRLVDPGRQLEIGHRVAVPVVADHVAVVGRGPGRPVIDPGEAASQVQLIGGRPLDLLPADEEIAVGDLAGKLGQVPSGVLTDGPSAA